MAIVVLSVAELSAGLLSGSFVSAVAVLVIVPATVGLTVSVIIADPPAAKLGIRQVTIAPDRVSDEDARRHCRAVVIDLDCVSQRTPGWRGISRIVLSH